MAGDEQELHAEYARYLLQYYIERDFHIRPMEFEEWDAVMHDYE